MKFKRFLFLALTSAAIASCTTPENPLVRKWTLDHIDASALMVDLPKGMQDTLQMMVDVESDAQKGKMSYNIQPNGKVTINSPDLMGKWSLIKGKWILNEEDQVLTIEIKDKRDEYIIHELNENKLVLELVDHNAERSMSGVLGGQRIGTKVKSVFTSKKS